MAGIQDFITQASSRLGIGRENAETATRGVLAAIQGNSSATDFSKLLGAVPGAGNLLKSGGSGGGYGDLVSSLGSALGGKAGGALGIIGALQAAGLDTAKGSQFLKMLMSSLQGSVGKDTLGSLVSKFPELSRLNA